MNLSHLLGRFSSLLTSVIVVLAAWSKQVDSTGEMVQVAYSMSLDKPLSVSRLRSVPR